MSDEILIRLDEITEKASVPQLKYWCKLLDISPKVISRAGHVSPKDAEKLRKMADLKYKPLPHNHKDFLSKAGARKGFSEAYNALELEYQVAGQMLKARSRAGLAFDATST